MTTPSPPSPVDLSLNVVVSQDGTELICNWKWTNIPNFSSTLLNSVQLLVDTGHNIATQSTLIIPSSDTSYNLTGNKITKGALHEVYIAYQYNGKQYFSLPNWCYYGTVPAQLTPENVNVTVGNEQIIITLALTQNTLDDGYSTLSTVTVIAKSGHSSSSTANYFSFKPTTTLNLYTSPLVCLNLTNNVPYDLNIYLENDYGSSIMYSYQSATPIPTPGPVQNLAAVANIVLNPTAGPGRTVLFNAPAYAGSGLNRIDSYSIVILDASSVPIGLPITCPTDASGNPVPTFCQYDSSRNIIQTRYNDVNYNYTYVDTSSDFSTRKYEVYAHNSYGDGAMNTTDLVQGCAIPGAPTIFVTPVVSMTPSIKVNVTDTLLNGLSLSSHIVKVWRTSDASENPIGGYYWSTLSLDPSNNATLTHNSILNGVSYTVAVKTVTALGSTAFTSAQATGSCVPYALPATPYAPTITDVSGGIPLDGKLLISWASVTAYTVSTGYGSDSSLNYQLIRADISTNPIDVGQELFYLDTGLTNGTTYSYTLRAFVWNNGIQVLSAASSPSVESHPFAAPVQVSAFTPVVHPSTSTVSYRFTDLPSDPNHNIQYKAQVFNSSLAAASTEVDVSANLNLTFAYSSFISDTNKLGNTYTIKITPYIVDRERTFPGPPTSASFIPYLVPGAPSITDLVPSNGSFFCSWSNVPGLDTSSNVGGVHIISYSVQVLDENLTAIGLPSVSSNLYFSTTGLTNGIQYGVQISPVGLIGNNVTTGDQITFLQSSADNTSIIPSNTNVPAPIFLKYDPHDTSVTLNWLQLRTFNGTWNIYKDFVPLSNLTPSSRAATSDNVQGTAIIYGNYTLWSVDIPNLTNGKPYTFIISAENSAGIGSNMGSTITAVSETPPDPVSSVQFSSTTSSLTLSWTAPTLDGGAAIAVGYGDDGLKYRINVYDITDMSGGVPLPTQTGNKLLNSTTLITNMPVNTSSTSATFSSSSYPGIKHGYTYASTIVAFVDYNYSFISNSGTVSGTFESISSSVTTRPMLVTSAAPEVYNVTAVASNSSVTLSWSDPSQNVYVLSAHKIYRSVNGVAFSIYHTVLQSAGVNGAFTYTDTDVVNGNSYQYNVVLTNTTTSPPAGIQSSTVTPSGLPIIGALTTTLNGVLGQNFSLTINKNGADLSEYLVVGLIPDASGSAIPYIQGAFTNIPYTTLVNNTGALLQSYVWPITLAYPVTNLLVVVSNARGNVVATWSTSNLSNSNAAFHN
jgi:hypothetical protein